MAAINQVALIPGGCQQSGILPVVSHASTIAYCSTGAIYMHTATTASNDASTPSGGAAATTTNPTEKEKETFRKYPLTRIFASGVVGSIQSFDYNDEYMACVTNTANSYVWRVADAELLNEKRVPSNIASFFQREGGPSVVRIAGKHHIVFGTRSGWVASANMNDGATVHQLRLCIHEKNQTSAAAGVPTPTALSRMSSIISPPSPSTTVPAANNINNNDSNSSNTQVGCVTFIDVSSSRPDTIVVGTSEGVFCILSIHPSNGLRQIFSFRPFSVPAVATDISAANAPTSNGNDSSNEVSWLPITTMAFDPNNHNYVAIGSREGALALVDISSTNNNQIIQTYTIPKRSVMSISWLSGQAGTFVTCDGETSKVYVWTINSRTPVLTWHPMAGSSLFGVSSFAPEHLFLALRSGNVAVYNIRTQQIEMKTEAGHTDAMHTCRYSYHDKDMLASVSRDGSVRIWNTKLLTLQHSIDVGRVSVHALDWSVSGKYIAVGLNSGDVVCYYVHTQREHWRAHVISMKQVNYVSWSRAESSNGYIAASHDNGVSIISSKDGKILRQYKTPSPVFGVQFDCKRSNQLATGCKDGQIFIYNLSSTQEEPFLILSGHTDAVTNVLYNVYIPHFLLSCSHDHTIRLWDVTSGVSHTASVSSRALCGHTNKVNDISWCSIAPYLLLSASADCTVRLWDIRFCVNLLTVRAHNGEIVSLSTHAERPFVFASASHDTTIIFWQINVLKHIFLHAVLGTLDQNIISEASSAMLLADNSSGSSSFSFVIGDVIQELNKELKDANLSLYKRMEKLINFFEFPYGAADISRVAGFFIEPQDLSNAKCTVLPASRLIEIRGKWGKTNVEKAHGKTATNAGEEYKKKKIIEAAESMMQMGKITEYCQLMAEVGEWDSAISAAPVVSRELWRSLCIQAAEAMEAAGSTRAVKYFIMGEESHRAAQFISRQSDKNWDVATVIAQTCPQHTSDQSSTTNANTNSTVEPPHNVTVDTNGVSVVVKKLLHARDVSLTSCTMNPRIVAATKLINGLNDDAVMHLIHNGDVVIAHLLIHTIPLQQQTTIDAGYRLSMLQSCQQEQWDTALLCAVRQSNPYDGLAIVLALYQQTEEKKKLKNINSNSNNNGINSMTGNSITNNNNMMMMVNEKIKTFHEKVLTECQRLQLPLDMENIQRRHSTDGLGSINQLAAMILTPKTPLGTTTHDDIIQTMSNFIDNILQAALQDIDNTNAVFYLKQAFSATYYISLPIQLNTSLHSITVKKFLAYVFLLATLMCVKVYRFPKFLNYVFTKAREFCEGDNQMITLLSKVQQVLGSYSPHSIEVECTTLGGGIPAYSVDGGVQLKSALTAEALCGELCTLEDGTSVLGKSEALEWMLCCAFSPLATGARFLPL